jgi:hypothetical protein
MVPTNLERTVSEFEYGAIRVLGRSAWAKVRPARFDLKYV